MPQIRLNYDTATRSPHTPRIGRALPRLLAWCRATTTPILKANGTVLQYYSTPGVMFNTRRYPLATNIRKFLSRTVHRSERLLCRSLMLVRASFKAPRYLCTANYGHEERAPSLHCCTCSTVLWYKVSSLRMLAKYMGVYNLPLSRWGVSCSEDTR